MSSQRGSNRFNNYHSTKRQVLGPPKQQPAWRNNAPSQPSSHADPGGKVLVAGLPTDVEVTEVQELFQRTVSPVKDVFLLYNSQGISKGMSIVTFPHAKSAVLARQKYHGKLIDNRHRIKIEIIHDSELLPGTQPTISSATMEPSLPLLSRIAPSTGGTLPKKNANTPNTTAATNGLKMPHTKNKPISTPVGAKKRQKKGPKRVNKRPDLAQLDQEMDEYQARLRS